MRRTVALAWGAVLLPALAAAPLLARNALAIGSQAPLDPDEGWNAAHAMAAMAGGPLYPAGLMVNNYPPLSFYIAGMLGRLTGDVITAGRLVSLLSFLMVAAGIAAALRRLHCGARAAAFGALFFAAALLVASGYVGMDDPQLLGHAVQMAALLLVLRRRIVAAALLFGVSLFIKHNLIALPLATGLWLLLDERRAGLRFLFCGVAGMVLGVAAFRILYGVGLWSVVASPRLSSFANVRSIALPFLSWAIFPLAALALLPRDRRGLFCALYCGVALLVGTGFSAGDGVDINILFDAIIALSLGLGLVVERHRWIALSAAPLLVFLAVTFEDNNFAFTRDFADQSTRDIAFLKAHPGPAICDQISLCLWAGKPAMVDVFNVGEQIATGARDPAALAQMIAAQRFAALQFESLEDFPLGPHVLAAIQAQYRIDHSDDNGVFLVPKT